MKIGAYQFNINKDIKRNMDIIKRAIKEASEKEIELIIFSECALTGYPPLTIESCEKIDFDYVRESIKELQELSEEYGTHIIIGSVVEERNKYYNSAILISPYGELQKYHKRALWGWDKENFIEGNTKGIFKIKDLKIGIRICFEVRFPEYFRELYKEETDINIVIFYDVSETNDIERYDLIKAHLQTRAVENVTTIISVNNISPYQTAPTAIFNKSGKVIEELKPNIEGLLGYNFKKTDLTFSEKGRKVISDNFK